MEFEWDARKALINKQKHGVAFEEAITVFQDPQTRVHFDREDQLTGEDRFLAVGFSEKSRLLVVCHVHRDGTIRIISARKLSSHEETNDV